MKTLKSKIPFTDLIYFIRLYITYLLQIAWDSCDTNKLHYVQIKVNIYTFISNIETTYYFKNSYRSFKAKSYTFHIFDRETTFLVHISWLSYIYIQGYFTRIFFQKNTWLEYCRYVVKPKTIIQSINQKNRFVSY